MKYLLILSLITIFNLRSQNMDLNTPCSERSFSNQGEQEDCWAEEFFEREYRESKFIKFDGEIKIENLNTIAFNDKILVHWSSEKTLEKIFTEGLFYPQLLIGYDKAGNVPINDSLKQSEIYFAKIAQATDTLKISSFEELKFLNTSPQTKRFRFWVHWPHRANAQVFLLELKNNNATTETTVEEYIHGARLTFLKSAWIII